MHYFLILSLLVFSAGCGSKNEHNHSHEDESAGTASTNDALYNEVMNIHDEVMPKMDDLYKMKEELKKQLALTTDLTEEKRKELEDQIAKVEEASKGMMVWMREFNAPADSLGEDVVRQYLEGQLEAVKKVKEDIQLVLPAKQ
jgi:RNase adaptor protein for sRNA GlmZ degradation